MTEKLVYASGQQIKKNDKKPQSKGFSQPGPNKVRLEKKGRGGKQVTVLFNLTMDKKSAKTLMREFQAIHGCGATLKSDCIEFRGDWCTKIQEFFQSKQLQLIRAGG